MPEAANDTGAGNNGNGGVATQGGSQGGGGQGSGTPAGQQQGQQSGDDYSLASGFLERVAPEHRAIIEPYVKQWDAGVTRRFGELHSQLQPYQELGDIENLQNAIGLVQLLEENPWQVYGTLHEMLQGQQPPPGFGVPQPQQQAPGQQQYGQQGLPNQAPPVGGQLPPEVQAYLTPMQEQMQKQQALLVNLAEHMLGEQRTASEQEEDAQLDEYLTNLHSEFGDFDDDTVLTFIYRGMSPEDAVKAFNEPIQQRVEQQMKKLGQVPPILGAGGGNGVSTQQGGVKDLNRKDTQALVAQVLAKSAEHRQ